MSELRSALGGEADLLFAEADGAVSKAADRIRGAIDAYDHPSAEREAHRLAGLASNFGLDGLADAARAVEAEARAGATSAETLAAMMNAARR
jgi:HPt (histidine-containing phosphotransfer) domain-containing protein